MDDLARRLVIARGDGIGHQKLLNELSDVDLLVIDDFLTVGIDEHRFRSMRYSETLTRVAQA
jgi:DNA replication protein DnaC